MQHDVTISKNVGKSVRQTIFGKTARKCRSATYNETSHVPVSIGLMCVSQIPSYLHHKDSDWCYHFSSLGQTDPHMARKMQFRVAYILGFRPTTLLFNGCNVFLQSDHCCTI